MQFSSGQWTGRPQGCRWPWRTPAGPMPPGRGWPSLPCQTACTGSRPARRHASPWRRPSGAQGGRASTLVWISQQGTSSSPARSPGAGCSPPRKIRRRPLRLPGRPVRQLAPVLCSWWRSPTCSNGQPGMCSYARPRGTWSLACRWWALSRHRPEGKAQAAKSPESLRAPPPSPWWSTDLPAHAMCT